MPTPNAAPFDFQQLRRTETTEDREGIIIQPAISVTYYLDVALRDSCLAVATWLDAVLEELPNTFRSYYAPDGYYKRLTSRQINKDRTLLRSLPEDYEAYFISYSDVEVGDAPGHHVLVNLAGQDEIMTTQARIVRLVLPAAVLQTWGEAKLTGFFRSVSSLLPFTSGHAGLAFSRWSVDDTAIEFITPWLPRLLGVDPSEHSGRDVMHGRSYSAHWVNFLSAELTQQLGGIDQIRAKAPTAEVLALPNGTWIRGARFPPIGDVNRGAPDLGAVPDVARLLEPIQPKDLHFAYTDFDANQWLRRFDNYPAQPWENG